MLRRVCLALSLVASASAQDIPVEATVHPGAELVALAQWVTGSYPQPPDSHYKDDAWAQFGPHRDHPGLTLFDEVSLYPDFTELGFLLDVEAGTVREGGAMHWFDRYGRDTVQTMLEGVLAFGRDADFAGFRQRYEDARAAWEAEVVRSLREGGTLDSLDAFFRYGASRARPRVVVELEPLNGWGAHAVTLAPLLAPFGEDVVLYQVGPARREAWLPGGDLSFARDDGALAWHEAAHVYLRPGLTALEDEIEALSGLFDSGDERLQSQNVTTWSYAFEENVVRAVTAALTFRQSGERRYRQQVDQDERSGFVFTGRIADLILDEYADDPVRYPTFDAFLP
ncbi:MAG: DUF4932 domain-containing protein, partial [Bacteroidota bacterium]